MHCPKYIKEALLKRASAACRFNHYDWVIANFLHKNGLSEDVELYDYGGGVESIVNPYSSSRRVLEAIEAKARKD